MKQIELGNTGREVSQLALGCMLMGTSTSEGEAHTLLARYLDAGGNFLDTANCYAWWAAASATGAESENVLGRWLAASGKRHEVFLASKVGGMVRDPAALWSPSGEVDWPRARRNYEGAGAETLRRGIDASLRRLQTDYLDLYYVHVDDWVTPLEETLDALTGLVRAGKVRHIGWSNVRTERLESIRRLCQQHGHVAPVALQQQHTYLRPRAGLESVSIVDDAQLEHLRRHPELTLVAYSPVLKGVYDDPDKRRGHWVMESYQGPDSEARLSALARAARELGVRPNQLVLAWLLQQRSPRVIPLAGPRTLEQLEQHLEALRIELPPELVAQLDAVESRAERAAS
ncbi:MAG TPA: aldo/keto reductase [Polyangiaceae bacterium]|nr:aldo/keto reductase [Polyangiaceae bacterium]